MIEQMTQGNDGIRRALLAGLLVGLAARLTVFHTGGAGGIASVTVFWIFAVALGAFAVRQLLLRVRLGRSVPILKWCLILLALLVWTYEVFGPEIAIQNLLNLTLLMSILLLVGLAIRDSVRRLVRSQRASGQTS
jgi:hypothetical protein